MLPLLEIKNFPREKGTVSLGVECESIPLRPVTTKCGRRTPRNQSDNPEALVPDEDLSPWFSNQWVPPTPRVRTAIRKKRGDCSPRIQNAGEPQVVVVGLPKYSSFMTFDSRSCAPPVQVSKKKVLDSIPIVQSDRQAVKPARRMEFMSIATRQRSCAADQMRERNSSGLGECGAATGSFSLRGLKLQKGIRQHRQH